MTIITFQHYIPSTDEDERTRVVTIPVDFQHIDMDRRVRKIHVATDSADIANKFVNLFYGSVKVGRFYVVLSGSLTSVTVGAQMKPHDSMLVCPAGQQISIRFPMDDNSARKYLICIDQEEVV